MFVLAVVAAGYIAGERPPCLTATPITYLSTSLGAEASSEVSKLFSRLSELHTSVVVQTTQNISQMAHGQGQLAADFVLSEALLQAGDVAVPLLTGPISVPYNVPLLNRCVPRLNLSLALLRAIYVGNITVWQDARILAQNPYFASVAAMMAPIPIVRLVRGDYEITTDRFVDGLLYLHNVSVPGDAPAAYAGVDATWHALLVANPPAAWARISTPGAAAVEVVATREAMEAALATTVGAIGYTVGSGIWGRVPVVVLEGTAPDSVRDVQRAANYHADRLAASGALTTVHTGSGEGAPYEGYPLVSFVIFYLPGNSSAAACCSRVYWACEFARAALQNDAMAGGFIVSSDEMASELLRAISKLARCGGMSLAEMRARFDLTLAEVQAAAGAGPATQLTATVAGSAAAGAVAVVAVMVAAVWFYFRKRVAQVAEMEAEAARAPRGDVAMMFTDIENSSAIWRATPVAMKKALALHFAILRQHVRGNHGYEVKTEGDAMFAVFPSVVAAVRAACGIQDGLNIAEWPIEILEHPAGAVVRDAEGDVLLAGLRVRVGVATGTIEPEVDPTTHRLDYFGDCVNFAARLADLGHGGQIVVSGHVAGVVAQQRARCGMVSSRRLADAVLAGLAGMHEVHEVVPPILAGRLGRWEHHRATKADCGPARLTRVRRRASSVWSGDHSARQTPPSAHLGTSLAAPSNESMGVDPAHACRAMSRTTSHDFDELQDA